MQTTTAPQTTDLPESRFQFEHLARLKVATDNAWAAELAAVYTTRGVRRFDELATIDEGLEGTRDYLGLRWFWNGEYNPYLEQAEPAQRRAVHEAFLAEGLALKGASIAHENIILTLVDA